MTAQILFNQLAYIDRLTRGGFSPEQARASAEALETAFTESVATKSDLAEVRTALKQDIAEVRTEVKQENRGSQNRGQAGNRRSQNRAQAGNRRSQNRDRASQNRNRSVQERHPPLGLRLQPRPHRHHLRHHQVRPLFLAPGVDLRRRTCHRITVQHILFRPSAEPGSPSRSLSRANIGAICLTRSGVAISDRLSPAAPRQRRRPPPRQCAIAGSRRPSP